MSQSKKPRSVKFSKTVLWQLSQMDQETKQKLLEHIREIAEDPTIGTPIAFEDLPEDAQRAILHEDDDDGPIH